MNKLLIITGPTATGKTALGIRLAKKFDGEIISADSQQIYVGLDLERGKDKDLYKKAGITVWGLDLTKNQHGFNPAAFIDFASKKIEEISARNNLAIIVGGTGQYIKELLYPSETLRIKPNWKLRAKLSKYSVVALQEELQETDNPKWLLMNNSDRQNPRRLIRAIEIARGNSKDRLGPGTEPWNSLIIGLSSARKNLYERITRRRKDRPDLIAREFTLAKKQLAYQRKYLNALWFDIADPKFDNKILWQVEKFLQSPPDNGKNSPPTSPRVKK